MEEKPTEFAVRGEVDISKVGRLDVSDAVFVGDPLIRQWIPPQQQAPRPAGRPQ